VFQQERYKMKIAYSYEGMEIVESGPEQFEARQFEGGEHIMGLVQFLMETPVPYTLTVPGLGRTHVHKVETEYDRTVFITGFEFALALEHETWVRSEGPEMVASYSQTMSDIYPAA
jgi:hypothetical protein